ncbi:MAG: hypothetical protein E6I76_16190 [Chloroflexi bacterium]|nr:MAG: hypothetical protein E6I76_16190 [Chloroflexota bacterium]
MEDSHVVDVLLEWLRVRDRGGRPLPLGYVGLTDELENSALLHRMLTGRAPLAEAPPRSYGQPWYALVEDGVASNCELVPLKDRLGASPKVSINQTAWEVVGIIDGGYVVRYGRGQPLYVAERSPADPARWRLRRQDLWLAGDGVTPEL